MLLNNEKYCWAWDKVYIKSNGRMPCWCDAGETYTIIENRDFSKLDFVKHMLNHEEMRRMRLKILLGNEYFIKECKNCCCMVDELRGKHYRFKFGEERDQSAYLSIVKAIKHLDKVRRERGWEYGSIDSISEIQIEPSFPCNLKCGGCLQGTTNPLDTEHAPYILPYEWFTQILDSILYHNIQLRRIRFVGRGEPTLNKKYRDMIKYVNLSMPKARLSMDTNANQEFLMEYLLLESINCSIDGSDQVCYEKYRIGGNFDKAIDFMKKGIQLKEKYDSNCNIIWKYILFDVNDGISQLNEAQRIAKQIGIQELRFIITHTGSYDGNVKPSTRYQSLEDIKSYLIDNPIFDKANGSYAT